MAISIDGETLTITLPTSAGAGVLDIDAEVDLYSEWKKWSLLADNLKYEPAFRVSGGDALSSTVDAGSYFFLRNDLGWRIKPYEEDVSYNLTGNLVPNDSTIQALLPTTGAYTTAIFGLQPVTQNVDSIIDQQAAYVRNLQYHIEAKAPGNAAYGNTYYLDPYGGDDTNTGLQPDIAVKTFTAAQALVTDGNYDVIYCLATDPSGITTVDDTWTITKKDFSIRGPGNHFILSPSSQTQHTIVMTGDNITISGIRIQANTSYYAVHMNNDDQILRNVEIRGGGGGVLNNGNFNSLRKSSLHGTTSYGIYVEGDMTHFTISDVHCCSHTLTGVYCVPTKVDSRGIELLGECNIQNNGQYGVYIGANNNFFTIGANVKPHHNGSTEADNVVDLGTNTFNHHDVEETHIAEAVLASTVEGTYTVEQITKLVSAALAGKLSGAGTSTVTIRDINDTIDRIVATVDDEGNRTAVTLNVS